MLISGRMPGKARANNVFPDPGDPAISKLWTKDRTLFRHYSYADESKSILILIEKRMDC